MNRRKFFKAAALTAVATQITGCGTDSTNTNTVTATDTSPATLYYEFRIAKPEIAAMMSSMTAQATALEAKTGYLSMSVKQLIGDSTMVMNLNNSLKGILSSAYIDAANLGLRTFVFTLFIRFDTLANLEASGAKSWFTNTIDPRLHAYGKDTTGTVVKKSAVFDYYSGTYKTVGAGDANKIYKTDAEIRGFLKNQKDTANATFQAIPADGSVSGASIIVENHVTIDAKNTANMNQVVLGLMQTAQTTYQPSTNPTNGTSGTLADTNYKKAVTTEILQNIAVVGGTRNYIMHGVWESVADHENSHIDARFIKAAGPVGAYVIAGPVEPFYQTMLVHNTTV